MLKISGKKKLFLNVISKVIISMLVGASALISLMFVTYKPVYKVLVDGEEQGYIASKMAMEKEINKYVQNGDAKNTAYVLMNSSVDYELMLLKKDIELKDKEVFAYIKEKCEVYYKVYAVKVEGEEKCTVDTLEEAQNIVDSVNEKQKNFESKATVEIEEKVLTEYQNTENIEVAIADIIDPLQKENDEIIKKRVMLSSSKSVSKELAEELVNSLQELNFEKPLKTGVITSRYGWRSSGYHYGLDIGAPTGTPMYAAESGVVTYSAWCGNYGYLIKIQHAGGYETYYAHCSKLLAKVGDEVAKGDLIAKVGSTGRSSGPHVHLEVRYNGKTLDPEIFVYNK